MRKIFQLEARLSEIESWKKVMANLSFLKKGDVTDLISQESRSVHSRLDMHSEQINTLHKMLEMYKQVLDTSGIISRCDADRTEFQWDEARTDYLGRNFHFKVNQVLTKKEKQ